MVLGGKSPEKKSGGFSTRKKEKKQQLERASQMSAQLEQYQSLITNVEQALTETQIEVDQFGMSATKMDRGLTKVVDCAKDTKDVHKKVNASVEAVAEQLKDMHQDFDILESAYDSQRDCLDKQQKALEELREQSKSYTGITKTLSEVSTKEEEALVLMMDQLTQMHTFVGSIANLALQSAIEAGRTLESGNDYIQTAEKIRTLASEFGDKTETVQNEIQRLMTMSQDNGRQVHKLIGLLKDNNVGLAKMAKDVSAMTEQEPLNTAKMQREWRLADEDLLAIRDTVSTGGNKQDAIMNEMENIGSCYMEQQDSTAHMEELLKDMKRMLSNIEFNDETN